MAKKSKGRTGDRPPSNRPSPPKPAFQWTDRSGKVHGGRVNREAPHLAQERTQERGRPFRPRGGSGPNPRNQETFLNKATLDKNRKGFGFLIFEDRKIEDAFVPPREAEKFFHGDRVEVLRTKKGEVLEVKLIEHRFREIVGRFTPHPSGQERGGWIAYERKKAREEVFAPQVKPGVNPGDWVRAKLHFHEKGPFPVTAEILEIYGELLPPSADVGMIAAEYNLIEEHTEAAESEAKSFSLDVSKGSADMKDREDHRDIPFITIDGETARDFDDAVYVEKKAGGYVLWVAIADVSHYVSPGTALDKDAFSRATSVYFPERAFHMLPRALSENLCSLKPDVPRLAMTARMEIDRSGKRTSTEIFESVIQSKRRATYNQIQEEYEKNGKNSNWEFTAHFELYHLIKKIRSDRGSLDFNFPEAEMRVKPTGEVESITNRARLDAHRLIEEFMISANEAVTEWAMEKAWPFIYRVHAEPSIEALAKFQGIAATVGVNFELDDSASPHVLADLVRRFEGHPAETLLNMALLRSMKQAVYSSTHGIHYGLASQGYTHFTSPIRRYPDLAVHRQLRHALRVLKRREPALTDQKRKQMEESLELTAEHCSYRERLASDAERDANKLKQVRLMITHLGDDFDGRVVGMMDAGLFVQLNEPYVEGMIPKESMVDDLYEYNEDRMVFFGRRKRRTFQIGDQVKIKVIRAEIDRRQVEFGLLEHTGRPLVAGDAQTHHKKHRPGDKKIDKRSDKRHGRDRPPRRGRQKRQR